MKTSPKAAKVRTEGANALKAIEVIAAADIAVEIAAVEIVVAAANAVIDPSLN
jgi:hypothetical protein